MTFYYRLRTITAVLSLLVSLCAYAQKSKNGLAQPAVYQQKMQSSALLFMENKGQIVDTKGNPQPNILYTASSGGAKVYLTTTGIHYQFSKTDYPKGYDPFSKESGKDPQAEAALRKQIKTTTHCFTVELQGANLATAVTKQGQSDYYENYYLPQCPNGITGVHGYEKITFKNVYPNIDWVVYSKGGFMEYDFLVHPGGNPASIKLKIKDADNVSITPQGELLMKTSLGEVREKAPVSFADGRMVPSRFRQSSDGTIGFDVQAQPGKELRIDPSIVWSTYYGGSGGDAGSACAIDNSGNVYLTGSTQSATEIAAGGFQNTLSSFKNAYLVKFDLNCTRLWATYYGGNNADYAQCCALDGNAYVYIGGLTASTSGTALNGFQNTFGGLTDAFLVKFDANGFRIWATYYGGSNNDAASSCVVDVNSNVYLAGVTDSPSSIASRGFQNSIGGDRDAFLVKFDNTGQRLWSTYYGGSSLDAANNCAADLSGNIYITGSTSSLSGIANSGFQNVIGGDNDAFLVKFDNTGNRLWATYYGGPADDVAWGCAIDGSSNVYISGNTVSVTGVASAGYQNIIGGDNDAFLVKFDNTGNRLWATYYGGSETEIFITCSTDSNSNIYLSGVTNSTNNISYNGFQNAYGGNNYYDGFLTKFTASGNRLWGSYFGGPITDQSRFCVANGNNVYMTGETNSPSKVASRGFQNSFGGITDAFLVKIIDTTLCGIANSPTISTNYDTVCTGATPTLTIASGNLNSATRWQWYTDSCGGTPVGNTSSITFTPTVTTTYYVRGEGGCVTPGNCVSKTIYVKPKPVVTFATTPAMLCPGDTATILFTGTAPANATYTWNWGGGNVVTGSGAGPYKVVYNTTSDIDLTVGNGTCSIAATQQVISILPKPTAAFDMSDTLGCGQLSLSLSNKSGNATSWYWSFGDNAVSTDSTPQPHYYTKGLYTVSLKATNGNCSSTTTKIVRVIDKPVAGFVVTPGVNIPIPLSQAIFNFNNTSINASRYQWQFGDFSTSSLTNPSHQYTKPGSYTVRLIAFSSPICVDSFELKSIIIAADTIAPFTIPNAFSPNGDGTNDKWMITALQQITNCRVNIYNRWGQAVFTSTGYGKPWDGSYNSKPLPVDTYYYTITVGTKSYSGSVLLLR